MFVCVCDVCVPPRYKRLHRSVGSCPVLLISCYTPTTVFTAKCKINITMHQQWIKHLESHNKQYLQQYVGTAAAYQKVAGLIPAGVIGIFH